MRHFEGGRAARLTIAASLIVHGAFAAVAAGRAGHAARERGPGTSPSEIAIEVEPEPAPTREPTTPEPRPEPPAARAGHSHPYPVAPDHAAHPHDPSIEHARAAPAPAPAIAVAPATPDALPTFAMTLAPSNAAGPARADARAPAATNGVGVATDSASGDGRGEGDGIALEGQVAVRARLLAASAPRYPALAKSDQLEADVELEIVVDARGAVTDARVKKPVGAGFDRAALDAIRGYRFAPAERGGRAVAVRMRWVVAFRLR